MKLCSVGNISNLQKPSSEAMSASSVCLTCVSAVVPPASAAVVLLLDVPHPDTSDTEKREPFYEFSCV